MEPVIDPYPFGNRAVFGAIKTDKANIIVADHKERQFTNA